MAKRTIQSPGVEIRESDLSLRTAQTGTTTYIAGFAAEGPTDEVVGLGNISEFEQIYGAPKTPAERYFYHTARAALNSSGRLLVNRLPYGEASGAGFGSKISVLAYPAKVWDRLNEQNSTTFSVSASTYVLGRPTQFEISQKQYIDLKNGTLFDFSDTPAADTTVANGANLPTDMTTNAGITKGAVLAWGPTATIAYTTSDTLTGTDLGPTNGSLSAVGATLPDGTSTATTFTQVSDLSGAAVIVVNKGQSTIDDQFNGYYVGLADNTNINPASAFEAIDSVLTTTASASDTTAATHTAIPTSRFEFSLTATPEFGDNPATNSISQVMEDRITDYNLDTREFDDTLNVGVFKLRQSVFSKSANQLNYLLEEGYNGSIGYYRQRNAVNGGAPVNFSLEQVEDQSRNIDIIVNPNVSDQINGVQLNADGTPIAKVRVFTQALSANLTNGNITPADAGLPLNYFKAVPAVEATTVANGANLPATMTTNAAITQGVTLAWGPTATIDYSIGDALTGTDLGPTNGSLSAAGATLPVGTLTVAAVNEIAVGPGGSLGFPSADSLVPLGAYGGVQLKGKVLGSIPGKIDRALDRVRNDRKFDIDIIAEGGLGTIHTYMTTAYTLSTLGFDDTKTTDSIEALRTSGDLPTTGENARTAYDTIFSQFAIFAGPAKDGGRGDIIFIADPIRQILVTGKNNKIQKDPDRNFYVDVYWPLRHQFSLANTSYATVFANWMRVYDNYTGLYVYVPSSGFGAAKMASTDAQVGPWGAPAGFNRGIIQDASDIAISPNQRQRDDLYTVNLNPIANFADQGNVIFGQKTLLKQPSAFDRINVRRTFLYLEKITKKTMQFFLFENNTLFTRTRVINTLKPFFERVKADDGLYDFMIVCDERNNTGEVIDQNELVVDIYLKPVRTAEFILVNFYATRTDASFEELIGN